MKITILNTSESHPINEYLDAWIARNQTDHQISLVRSRHDLCGGDLLFLISCHELVSANDRVNFEKTLVIHASDLPSGRGWSPHIWSILDGQETITVTLLEAEDMVDSGRVWKKNTINISSTALYGEINRLLFESELALMDFAIQNFKTIVPQEQESDIEATYWPKRKPEDSELDIHKTIEEQFNLIRVCDPERYPAFFYKDGKKFFLKIEAESE